MNNFAEWGKWIEGIRRDVADAVVSRHIYDEVRSIVGRNRAIQMHSTFYGWMHRNYVHDSVMRLRRHVDRRNDSRGLRKLLEKISRSHGHLTFGAFAALWPRKHQTEAKVAFENMLGSGATVISRARVNADINELQNAVDAAKFYADNKVAHLSQRPQQMPSAKKVSDAIDVLENVYQRYKMLLTGQAPRLLPTWQYDWKKIFRVAWI